jgi:pilus assembly protein Flp/PilA
MYNMNRLRLSAFAADDEGATAIEYALIAAIIALAIVSSLTLIRGSLQSGLNGAATGLQSAGS